MECEDNNEEQNRTKSDGSKLELILLGFLLMICVLSNAGIVGHILKKNWNGFRSLHVHQINYFTGMALVSLAGFLVFAGEILNLQDLCPAKVLRFCSEINIICDIFIFQVDRFLAISKPIFYRTRIHAGLSIKIVIFSKMFSFFVSFVNSMVVPEFMESSFCMCCVDMHPINVYIMACLSLAAVFFALVVSIYVSIKAYETTSPQPNLVLLFDNHEVSKMRTNILPTSTVSNPISGRNRHTLHTIPAEILQNKNNLDSLGDSIVMVPMQQMDQYKSLPRNQSLDNCSAQHRKNKTNSCTQSIKIKMQFAFKMFKMNLLTLSLISIMVPTNVLTIICHHCDRWPGVCDSYFSIMLEIYIFQVWICCLHPIALLVLLRSS